MSGVIAARNSERKSDDFHDRRNPNESDDK
jgi:hypothetical protein